LKGQFQKKLVLYAQKASTAKEGLMLIDILYVKQESTVQKVWIRGLNVLWAFFVKKVQLNHKNAL